MVIPTDATKKIIVEYYNPTNASSDNLLLVKLDKFQKKKKDVYGFSTDIFEMKKVMPVNTETSVNHTSKIEYNVPSVGEYAIYDQVKRIAIPFIVK